MGRAERTGHKVETGFSWPCAAKPVTNDSSMFFYQVLTVLFETSSAENAPDFIQNRQTFNRVQRPRDSVEVTLYESGD